MTVKSSFTNVVQSIANEFKFQWEALKSQRLTIGLLLAIFCVFIVIVGNVIILIAVNFWLSIFPAESAGQNSYQIGVQVVSTLLMFIFFFLVGIVFACVFGLKPYYHCLFDTNRMMHPVLRFILLFASGASNAISSVLGVYSMTYTPEFLQAVFMCCIPFSAQAWSILFIREDRHRNYLSLFFIASCVFMVAGILLSSMSAFLTVGKDGTRVSWEWALIYLASSVVFGLWCVVQRLYLDGIVVRTPPNHKCSPHVIHDSDKLPRHGDDDDDDDDNDNFEKMNPGADEKRHARGVATEDEPLARAVSATEPLDEGVEIGREAEAEETETEELMIERKVWGSFSVEDNASKMVLLVVGIFFQTLVSFVVFPVDAIPWFGTSDSVGHAWDGFSQSVIFIFESWSHIRFGLLYSLGYVMSFIGCTFLNEHSPTLASVVMQLAGPITSIVILIIPQWNVYKDNGNVGHKVGGIILLVCAALCYHMWDQQSIRVLIEWRQRREAKKAAKAEAEQRRLEEQREEEDERLHGHTGDRTREREEVSV